MSKNSGLAAVDEAAATISQNDHTATVAAAREEGRKAGFEAGRAEGEKAGRDAGAAAERERILGIEKAALPGHGELIAKLKADPTVSVGAAAMQILAAERAKVEAAGKAISGVEAVTAKVTPAPASGDAPAAPAASAAVTPDAMRAEWEKSAQLQAEFPSAEIYVAHRKAELGGNVRILERKRG